MLRTLPKMNENSSRLPVLSEAKVKSIKATATISVESLPSEYIIQASCPQQQIISVVVFDKSGNLVKNDRFDNDKEMKTLKYGVMTYNQEGYAQGIYIVGNKTLVVRSTKLRAELFEKDVLVYYSKAQPLDSYYSGWVTGNKGTQFVDNRVFFVTNIGSVCSISINEAVASSDTYKETIHHTLDKMIEVWADRDCLYCLSKEGDLDYLYYKKNDSQVVKTSKLKVAAFPANKGYSVNQHEAVSMTGNSKYIAVATFTGVGNINKVWLLDRKGNVLNSAVDVNKGGMSSNTFHRMEFRQSNKCDYLVAQNLFNLASLFLINPKRKAEIHFIRKIVVRSAGVSWSLEAIPGKRDQLVSGCNSIKTELLKITLNYDTEKDGNKVADHNKMVHDDGEEEENGDQNENGDVDEDNDQNEDNGQNENNDQIENNVENNSQNGQIL